LASKRSAGVAAQGVAFLELMDGLYPGYAPGGFGSVIMGSLYALVDGAIGGAVFAWLYNRILGSKDAGPGSIEWASTAVVQGSDGGVHSFP